MDNEDLKELNAIFKDMGGVDSVDDYTNSFEELPDGTYLGEIEKVSTKNSKKTGRPMLEIIVALEEDRKEYVYLMLAGENLKKIRLKKGLTQVQISSELKINQPTWNRYENAKNLILTTTLYELAKKYHYSIDKILGYETDIIIRAFDYEIMTKVGFLVFLATAFILLCYLIFYLFSIIFYPNLKKYKKNEKKHNQQFKDYIELITEGFILKSTKNTKEAFNKLKKANKIFKNTNLSKLLE